MGHKKYKVAYMRHTVDEWLVVGNLTSMNGSHAMGNGKLNTKHETNNALFTNYILHGSLKEKFVQVCNWGTCVVYCYRH